MKRVSPYDRKFPVPFRVTQVKSLFSLRLRPRRCPTSTIILPFKIHDLRTTQVPVKTATNLSIPISIGEPIIVQLKSCQNVCHRSHSFQLILPKGFYIFILISKRFDNPTSNFVHQPWQLHPHALTRLPTSCFPFQCHDCRNKGYLISLS